MVDVSVQFSLSKLTCLPTRIFTTRGIAPCQACGWYSVPQVLCHSHHRSCGDCLDHLRKSRRRRTSQGAATATGVCTVFHHLKIFADLCARNFRNVINNIYTAALNLPKPIRRVCYVQLVAFLAWSVSTYYVSESNILIFVSSIGFLFCSTRQCPPTCIFISIDYKI